MSKRRKTSRNNKSSNSKNYLVIGGAIVLLGVAILLAGQYLLPTAEEEAAAPIEIPAELEPEAVTEAALAQTEAGDVTSLEEARTLDPVETEEPVTDRETRYLGPSSDVEALHAAEDGVAGQPTLVFFHADWCTICKRIEPEVIDLGEEYDGQVKVVRVNVEFESARSAVARYGVRGTPVFVLFDEAGEVRGNVVGWPGYETFVDAFDQVLSEG